MKINGNEIRPGNVLEHNGGLWAVVKTNAVKPGKGGAFNQVEMKNLIDGTKLNERFRASETVERIRLEQKDFQFLYEQGEALYEDRPIGIALPDHVTLAIAEADPVVKGQTAASSYKPAILENGVRILVPPFISSGERVIVDTNELTYLRRAD